MFVVGGGRGGVTENAAPEDKELPSKNSQPCGNHDHHIHTTHRTETSPHHSKGSCDQEIVLQGSTGSVHKLCSSSHQPVSNVPNLKLNCQKLIYVKAYKSTSFEKRYQKITKSILKIMKKETKEYILISQYNFLNPFLKYIGKDR